MKVFSKDEIAAYNAANAVPDRVAAAQRRVVNQPAIEAYPHGEFASRDTRGDTAEQWIENAMLHGADS